MVLYPLKIRIYSYCNEQKCTNNTRDYLHFSCRRSSLQVPLAGSWQQTHPIQSEPSPLHIQSNSGYLELQLCLMAVVYRCFHAILPSAMRDNDVSNLDIVNCIYINNLTILCLIELLLNLIHTHIMIC